QPALSSSIAIRICLSVNAPLFSLIYACTCRVLEAPVNATKPQFGSISRKERASSNDSLNTTVFALCGIYIKKSFVSLEGFMINCISLGSKVESILDRSNTRSKRLFSSYRGKTKFCLHIQLLLE